MENLTAVISNVQRFSTEDGPGIRTTVFFKGCPLKCPWCHNPEGLSAKFQLAFHPTRCISCGECKTICEIGAPLPGADPRCKVCGVCVSACPTGAREIIGRKVTVEALVDEVSRDIPFYGSDGGVTASGGEAAMQAEFVTEFFKQCRAKGIHTALDTSGAVSASKLKSILEHTDLVLFDLKIMDPTRHQETVGFPLPQIQENLRTVSHSGKPFWIRFPIVHGSTDDKENILAICNLLKNLPGLERVDLLPFHQLGRHKYIEMGMAYTLSELKPSEPEKIESIRRMFTDAGIPVSG
jgi:pyruvate formate lyase activating enzyme